MNRMIWNLNDYFNYGPCRANPSLGDTTKNHIIQIQGKVNLV